MKRTFKTGWENLNPQRHNRWISDEVHDSIPYDVRDIVIGHLEYNEEHKCQHNREILDEIILDLQAYAKTLPSVKELELCNVL